MVSIRRPHTLIGAPPFEFSLEKVVVDYSDQPLRLRVVIELVDEVDRPFTLEILGGEPTGVLVDRSRPLDIGRLGPNDQRASVDDVHAISSGRDLERSATMPPAGSRDAGRQEPVTTRLR